MAELGASLLGIGRKKSLSSQLSKRRLTEKAKADVEESLDAIDEYKRQIQELEDERKQAVDEINDRWGDIVNDISEVTITPTKTNIFVELFGVAWVPYYLVDSGGEMVELPAFGQE
jgi:hypothetical protein